MAENDDDGIGYGRPPLHSRFKPGESGNPRGRPKGAVSFKADLLEELSETIAVGGGEVRITKQRAIVKRLVAASLDGNPKATTALINLCVKLLPDQETDPRAAENEAFVDKLAERETAAEPRRARRNPEND
ncbi:DUF5681 domain-containing protein [Rhodoblastus sp.]|uniref:DUF5681 domain-containing protein n=1 Tax=Rhodoblastus sp. TaxID=1962975 RepID=UPI003F96B632